MPTCGLLVNKLLETGIEIKMDNIFSGDFFLFFCLFGGAGYYLYFRSCTQYFGKLKICLLTFSFF